jgi:hypothetical protein
VISVFVHISEDLAKGDNADAALVSNDILELKVCFLDSNVLINSEVSHIFDFYVIFK